MRLIELNLRNFKRFTERDIEFAPGLNLVWGPNESGKSTIHEAISCALFGRERGKPVERWTGGACFVRLVYQVNGRVFAIERKLSEGSCRLGVVTGDDLTDIVTDKAAVEEMIGAHLGLSDKAVFDNTVSIRQSQVGRLTSSVLASVGQEVQRVLTGTAQGSATQVLAKLRNGEQEIIGKPRPKKPREYETLSARLQELAQTLAEARKSRDRIRDIEQEIGMLEEKVARESDRLSVLDELLTRHRRWAELKKSQAEIEEAHTAVFSTVRKLKDHLEDLKHAQKEIEERAELVGKVDELYDHLTKLASRRTELEERLRGLQEAGMPLPAQQGRLGMGIWLALTLAFTAAALGVGLAMDFRFLLLLIPGAGFALRYMQLRMALGRTEHRQLAQLLEEAEEELRQVGIEEESILSYMKCADPGRAFMKIKSFRSQITRVHDLEIAVNTLLSGRKLADLEKQEAELARDLSTVNRELSEEFPDYSPSTEESEGWRSEHASLQRSVSGVENRLHALRGELEAERRNARNLAGLEGELEFLHRRKAELEFLHKAYGEAISGLKYVIEKVSEEYLPALSVKATEGLMSITGGRYSAVRLDSNWNITLDCVEKSDISPSVISAGTADQVYFALRAACGDLLSAGRSLPVILDDPFVNFDRARLDRVLEVLEGLAEHNQVILFTHDPHTLDRARESHVTIHDLSP